MTVLALALPAAAATGRPHGRTLLLGAALLLALLLMAAFARELVVGHPVPAPQRTVWLALHLATVIPAVPLGGYVLWARKGGRRHRLLGRVWAGLMLVTALAAFGVRGTGHLSWIHLFSVLVLVTVPRGVWQAMRGRIAAHRRTMTFVYAGLVSAGFFTFLPGRLLGQWLFG